MKAIIGNSLVHKLKPKERQYDVRDVNLKGFLIRVTPTGKMSYVCQYNRGRRINIGQVGVITPAQARDKAKQILSQAVMGLLPKEHQRNKLTLEQFVSDEYENWRKANRKNGIADLKRLRVNFVKEFGNRLLGELTPIVIEKWRTGRINNGIYPSTVNRDIVILKSMLSKAVEWEFISENPLTKLKPFKVDSVAKVRYLDKNEENQLKNTLRLRDEELKEKRERGNQWRRERNYDCLPTLQQFIFADYMSPMILVTLNIGLRRGELFNLTWDDINFMHALLTVKGNSAKSGKTRHVPLNTVALQALKDWQQHGNHFNGLVFSNAKTGIAFGQVKKSWVRILEKADIKNFRWHDMRHHFASKLVMTGVDLNTVRELLGHADIKMTLRYAHLAPEHKANAVAKLVTQDIY